MIVVIMTPAGCQRTLDDGRLPAARPPEAKTAAARHALIIIIVVVVVVIIIIIILIMIISIIIIIIHKTDISNNGNDNPCEQISARGHYPATRPSNHSPKRLLYNYSLAACFCLFRSRSDVPACD